MEVVQEHGWNNGYFIIPMQNLDIDTIERIYASFFIHNEAGHNGWDPRCGGEAKIQIFYEDGTNSEEISTGYHDSGRADYYLDIYPENKKIKELKLMLYGRDTWNHGMCRVSVEELVFYGVNMQE